MDLDALRIFVKVAELASFTRAAEQLGEPKARVSQLVQRLETQVGARLLHRTTRTVRVTPDGEQFLARAKTLVGEADELGAMFAAAKTLRGRVRIDLPISLSRDHVVPRLPELLARHPRLEIQLSTTDRIVDVVREGFDIVLRVGTLAQSDLVAMRVGHMEMLNVASAGYLETHGRPRKIDDLDDHYLVHYSPSLGDAPELEWHDGTRLRARRMKCRVTVNSTDAFVGACVAGLGIAQIPRAGVTRYLATGELVEILPAHRAPALPVSLLHPHGQNVPRRVRVVIDWLAATLEERAASHGLVCKEARPT